MDIQQREPIVEERTGVPTFAVEAGVAALVLLMGLVVTTASWKLGAGWMSDGPGAGYFPFYIGVILCISGAGTLYQSLFGKKRNHEIFVDGEQIKRVLMVLVPAAIYVGAIQLLGMYVASAIYIAAFMIVLGKFSRIKSVLLGVAIAVLFFAMFEVWFKVPLEKGLLNPTGFLGY
ncbi:tripartite tricarboxylate transporter TctB family protein [Ramlibacter alkalitolerans]|uniref:Tripartite tricarboxylate transporter TctB family protein n=1 Tax=Ramlibacter alkalitolerans TaxID=2039631 RepID=A0ABS1JW95_9BURK|nr:tripartite tricarboxylate transporter TctB family protein [Ramlibacter alkalitolerans]MBL0428467.1 tripartite tricarboxylate transporter TctB family protein [Ramlibacter alkalitolerans]